MNKCGVRGRFALGGWGPITETAGRGRVGEPSVYDFSVCHSAMAIMVMVYLEGIHIPGGDESEIDGDIVSE